MITEFLSVYSRFCSKILRIWQKFAVEYCSYKGLTLYFACQLICLLFVEYCSYKGLTHYISGFTWLFIKLNIVLIKD